MHFQRIIIWLYDRLTEIVFITLIFLFLSYMHVLRLVSKLEILASKGLRTWIGPKVSFSPDETLSTTLIKQNK